MYIERRGVAHLLPCHETPQRHNLQSNIKHECTLSKYIRESKRYTTDGKTSMFSSPPPGSPDPLGPWVIQLHLNASADKLTRVNARLTRIQICALGTYMPTEKGGAEQIKTDMFYSHHGQSHGTRFVPCVCRICARAPNATIHYECDRIHKKEQKACQGLDDDTY